MGSYRTTLPPGIPSGDTRCLLGANSLGLAVFLSRACLPHDGARHALSQLARAPSPSPLVAGLVEVGEAPDAIWVVETAVPCAQLRLVASRSRELGRPMPTQLAAFLAMRLCQACASLPTPHRRVSPRTVFLQPSGEAYLIGASWARLVPPSPEDTAFTAPAEVEDARSDAFAIAQIARALAGGEEGWVLFTAPLRSAFERAGAGPRQTCKLSPGDLAAEISAALGPEQCRTAPSRLAAWLVELDLPKVSPPSSSSPAVELMALQSSEPESGPTAADRVLALDGQIEGQARPGPAPFVAEAPRAETVKASGPLELDEESLAHARAEQPHAKAEEIRQEQAALRRASRKRAVVGFLIAALVLTAAAAALWFDLPARLHLPSFLVHSGRSSKTTLRVESEPSGAAVRVGSEQIGETPFIGDNDFGDEYAVYVEKAGYHPARLVAQGGKPMRLSVKLVPKTGKR